MLKIAVCDPASSYRRGLGAALAEAGYWVEEFDLRGEVNDTAMVLLTIRSAPDWEVLRELCSGTGRLKALALLVDPTPVRHAEALRCGAHASVDWEASPETIVWVVAAALRDMTLLPTPVAHAIGACGPPLCDPDRFSEEELAWLRLLARGVTIQQLAQQAGYSERALYRLLHGLYERMGVGSRTEAILQATRWGLLEE